MTEIKEWVFNIAAVAVLMVVLDLLIPEGKIRKFTQLLAGFIMMLVIMNPVINWLGKGDSISLGAWKDQVFLLNRQLERTAGDHQEAYQKQTLALYREMLLSDLCGRLKSNEKVKNVEVDVVLNENTESEKFGAIRKLYINLIFPKSGINQTGVPEQEMISAEIRKEIQQVFLLDKKDILIQISEE